MGTAISLALTVLQNLPALIAAGQDVIALINSTSAVIVKSQATGTDPTDADWKMLDDMLIDLRKRAAS